MEGRGETKENLREELVKKEFDGFRNEIFTISKKLLDPFWGCGPDGQGKNFLGIIFMLVRRDNVVGTPLCQEHVERRCDKGYLCR
jgi:hypothetical protein